MTKIAKGCKTCPIYKNKLCKGVKNLTALSCQKTSKSLYKEKRKEREVMSKHIKLDKQGYVVELLATNEDAVLANAAPQLLKACEFTLGAISQSYSQECEAKARLKAAIAAAKKGA